MDAAHRSTVGPAWSDHRVYEEPSTWTDDSAAHYTGEDFFDDLNPDCTYVDDRLGRPHKLPRSPILPVHHTDGGRGTRGREAVNLGAENDASAPLRPHRRARSPRSSAPARARSPIPLSNHAEAEPLLRDALKWIRR